MIYPINHLPGDIPVGVQTEQGVEVIGFDLKPWLDALPDMDFSVWHTRPGEKEAYPAKDQMMVGTVLYWHPDSYDTAIAGDGKVEIAGVGDNQRKLSGFVKTSIRATSLGMTKEPGENFPPWYEAVLQAAQDVKVDVNVGTGGLYLVRSAAKEGSYIFRTDRTIEEVREAVAAGKTCILVHDEGRVYTYCGEMPLSNNMGINVPTFAAPPKYKQGDGFEYRQVQMKPDGTALLSGYSVAKTPNPYKLTIGGVDYDGSKAVTVEIPDGGTVEVDATLTKANAAADAKVVGDRFTSLSEEIEALDESLFTIGYSEEKVNVPTDTAIVEPEMMVTWYRQKQSIAAVDLVKYPVSTGQRYYITNVYRAAAALYAFEKADGTIFGAYPTAEESSKVTVTDYEIIVPDEAVYLLINDVSRWQSYTYTLQTLAPSEEKTFRAKALLPNYVPSRLYGKKLVACGDSITDGSNPDGGYFKNYAELVAERHGMVYHKDAIGGSTMTNVEGKNPFCVSRYLNHTDFDYLTIWFGWNDGAYAELGTIEDTEDTTFYGAYKKVLTHYMTNYPTKKIGIVVPYGFRTNIQQAVREISEMFGVPCLDLADGKRCSLIWGENNEAQIARRAALTYDTTHPNQAGHEFIATMYEHFLCSL